jgi:hypothetical protein
MLQNRVGPFGDLIKTNARGSWMGNRGILHNEQQQILRPYKLKAWITCVLAFKDRKREVMSPNRYTELFFFDEATSFAAGHRPCFECRRNDYNRFKVFWLKGNPEYGFNEKTSIQKIDDIIHQERIDRNKSKVTFEEDVYHIPDGSFILIDDKAFLVFEKKIFLWSPYGYETGKPLPEEDTLTVITPRSLIKTFQAGYQPQINLSIYQPE